MALPRQVYATTSKAALLQMMQDVMQDAIAAFAKGSKGKGAENLPKKHSLKRKKKERKKSTTQT